MSDLDIERAVDQITEDLRPYVRAAMATKKPPSPPTVDVRGPVTRCLLDVNTMYLSLDAKRTRLDMSWRAVARQCGVSASTFTRLKAGHPPNAHVLCSLIWWLDYGFYGFIGFNPRWGR